MDRTRAIALTGKRLLLPLPYLTGVAHFTIEFSISMLPLLYPLLIESMNLTYQQVGAIALMVSGGGTISQPIFGYLSDKLDRRIFMVFSVTWVGLLVGLVGLMPVYWGVVLVVTMGALGSAAFHPSGAAVAASSDPEHRGGGAAIFSVSGGLGTAVAPLVFGAGIAWFGVHSSIILIPIGLLVTVFLLLQYRSYSELERSKASEEKKSAATTNTTQKSLLILVLTIVAVCARSWLHGGLITYLPEWLQNNGLSPQQAGVYFSILTIMVSLGSLLGGNLSDRLGRAQVVAVSFLLVGPAFWFFLQQSGALQIVAIGLVGFTLGLSFPITIVMAQEAWPHGIGIASALVMGMGWLPYGVGSLVLGRIADKTTLTDALGTLVYVPLIGLVVAVFISVYVARMKRVTTSTG